VSDDLSIPNPGYRGSRAGRYGTGQSRVRQGMDPDTRRLMLFAGGLGAVLAVLIGASALTGRHANEVPVVTADPRPIREKPLNPGGMKIDAAENDVFSGVSDTGSARLAPASETPDAEGLHDPAPSAPIPSAPTPSGPAAAIPPPAAPSPPAGPAAAPRAPAANGTAAQPEPKTSPAKPVTAEAHPAPFSQQPMVQLAALTTEDAARAEWTQLAKKLPELLNGRQPNFSRIERGGRTFWRVRTGGFADMAQARSFCEKIRAKSAGCSVANF
jgi:cell division septation protein DedD